MADKEVLFRFSSEGLQEILQQLTQVTQSLQGGLQGGGTSANPGQSSPIAVTSKGPYAPSAQQGSTTAAAAMNAAMPAPMPVVTGNVYTAPPGTPPQPASPYRQPPVPIVAAPGTGAANGAGAYFNGSTYEIRNESGRVMTSGMSREDAIGASKFFGYPGGIINEAQQAAQKSIPTQSFYRASGMDISVGGQVVAQGIPGIATPTTIAQQATGLNQAVMAGSVPVPQAIIPNQGAAGMPGWARGMLGMPMIGMSSALGGYFLGAAGVSAISQMGSAYGSYAGRAATGHTVYPFELAAGMVAPGLMLGGMAGGAALGSMFGGIGAIPGAMGGMALGAIANAAAGPYIQQLVNAGVDQSNYMAIKKAFGYKTGWQIVPGSDVGNTRGASTGGGFEELAEIGSSAPLRQIMMSMAISGFTDKGLMPVMFGQGRQYSNEAVAAPMIQSILSGMRKPEIFGRYGYGSASHLRDIGISAVMEGDYTNPMIQARGLKDFAEEMGKSRYNLSMDMPRFQRASIAYGAESQFGGYQASAGEYSAMQRARGKTLADITSQIESVKKRHGEWSPEYENLLTQKAQIEYEKRQASYQREMLRFGESEARYGLREQRAGQAFEYARATGTQPEDLPWQRQAEAYSGHAGAIRGEMARLRSKKLLSPMQEYQMTQEAEAEEYRAKMIPLQKEGAVWDIRESRGQRYIAQTHAANVGLSMLGGPNERYEAAQRDIEANQMLLELEQKRLANDKSLTAEKREQLGTTIAHLQASQTASRIEAERAKASGIYSMAVSDISITRAGISQQYAKGAGGAAATGLISAGLGATASQMGAIQALIDNPSTDPVTRKQMQAQQANMWTEYYSQIGEAGAPPMSAKQRAGMSNVQTALNIATTTFAQQADIRGLLESQMKQIGARIGDLGRNRATLMKEGKWTDESEARYTEERNSWLMQAAGAQHQLEEGWLDRLVSQTWNAPGSFTMIASQFTRREASLFAGITSRAFGGGREQSDYWRRQYPARYTSMIGKVGTQEGFMETGMAKGTAGASVNGTVTVRVEVTENNKLIKTQNQVLQIQSSTPNFDKINPTQHNANTRGNYQ